MRASTFVFAFAASAFAAGVDSTAPLAEKAVSDGKFYNPFVFISSRLTTI
jgi:hypothetical protein